MLVNKFVGPTGTHFSDGVKIGPGFWSRGSYINPETGLEVSGNGVGYSALGPGVFLSPQTTWTLRALNGLISPLPEANVVDVAGNITANGSLTIKQNPAFSDTDFTEAPWVLSQSNLISNQFFYQMDWPRGITISKGNTQSTASVRVSGYNYWGAQMTRTIALQAGAQSVVFPVAFYTITKVTIFNYNAGGGAGLANFVVRPNNFFGFPYVLAEKTDLINAGLKVYYFDNNNFPNANEPSRSINLLGNLNKDDALDGLCNPLQYLPLNSNLIEAQTESVPVPTMGDRRGGAFVNLAVLAAANQPLFPPQNNTIGSPLDLSFTYLVRGNDPMFPIENTLQWPAARVVPAGQAATPLQQWKCFPRSPIKFSDVYGLPEYFDPQDFS